MPAPIENIDEMQAHLNKLVWRTVRTNPENYSKLGHSRCFSLIVTALMGVLMSSWASTAYLPAVGPAPLRFRPAFRPITNSVVPPPPVPAQPPVPPPAEKTGRITLPIPAAPAPASVPAAEETDAVAERPPSDGTVSPQMLLRFFNKSTNGVAAGGIAPLDFTPPRTAEPPSSKAEFSNPPH